MPGIQNTWALGKPIMEAILFEWRNADAPEQKNYTVWTPFNDTTKYFEPSHKDYMINFRVEDIEGLLAELKKEGVQL